MKKLLIALSASVVILLVFQSFMAKSAPGAEFPAEVKEILKTSCYDCHSDASTNKKAIEAVNFDKWSDLKATKQISKLDAVCETISKDQMPPEKYLKNKPEHALSDEQKVIICSWADQEASKLMKGN